MAQIKKVSFRTLLGLHIFLHLLFIPEKTGVRCLLLSSGSLAICFSVSFFAMRFHKISARPLSAAVASNMVVVVFTLAYNFRTLELNFLTLNP